MWFAQGREPLTAFVRRPMVTWPTKADQTFGVRPGAYRHSSGCAELFLDLLVRARRATREHDEQKLQRVLGCVQWAAALHGADGVASAVDLAFLLPGFRAPETRAMLRARLPATLVARKWRALMDDPAVAPEAMDSREPPA